MATTNDEVILELKKKIEDKRKLIKSSEKFSPVTNCSLDWNGQRFNLNVMNKEQLQSLLIFLHGAIKSALELEILEDYEMSGYRLTDWATDVKAKLAYTNRKAEESKLRAMENKLDSLLSNDKRVELELKEIMNNL